MAATTVTSIDVPVKRPRELAPGWYLAPIAAGGAVLLAVAVALIFTMVLRGLAPAPAGHGTGTHVVEPHPRPGPFGD